MTYQRSSRSPFRHYSNTDGTGNTYNDSSGDQLDNVVISNIAALSTGYWTGFNLRDYCSNRSVFGHAAQSWTQSSLLASITSYTGPSGPGNNTDKSLMSTLHGVDSGSFNFGDDSIFWFVADSTKVTGPNLNAVYNSGTAPNTDNNASANFALLTFVQS
tara:strand:- start:476 stop:952 length:477 start_codon:yes stop_codon:yes gene_type:complete